MFYKVLSNICYAIGFIAGYIASYQLLLEVYPSYSFDFLTVIIYAAWFFFTLEVFYLLPLYPGLFLGEWTLSIICYGSFVVGIIFGNQSRKLEVK
tara:strand:- start:131 stop:415 length:285 start_codon:yes stop_codon:yes gene_type:complete